MPASAPLLNWKIFTKESEHYKITGPILPFEIWRLIFLDLFADLDLPRRRAMDTAKDTARLYFVLSDLQARFIVFSWLWTSKYWYAISRDVFFEDLQLDGSKALQGAFKTICQHRELGESVHRISLSFPAFRETESVPPKSRPCQVPDGLEIDSEDIKKLESDRYKIERSRQGYRASETNLAVHWRKWQGLCRDLLARCRSLHAIEVIFTSDFNRQRLIRSSRDYASLFEQPDLSNDGVLRGLQSCTNLQKVHFVDPSPLEAYGPGLRGWKRLKSVTIILSPSFPDISDLPNTAFCPPRNLKSLTLHVHPSSPHHWPLRSDITMCQNLTQLDLGLTVIQEPQTAAALEFLIWSYRLTLTKLTLRDLLFGKPHTSSTISFAPILQGFADRPPHDRISMPNLQYLHLASLEPLALFRALDTPQLLEVRLGGIARPAAPAFEVLDGPEQPIWARPAEWWKARLSVPSLGRLKRLSLKSAGRADHLAKACSDLGIALDVKGHSQETQVPQHMEEFDAE